jgi:hypothetical protein
VLGGLSALAGAALFGLGLRMDRRWLEIHLTEHSCAETRGELLRAYTVRILCFVAGVVLVALAPRIVRWARRRTPWEIIGAGLRIVVPAALAIVVCDIALRPVKRKHHLHYEPDSEGDDRFQFRPQRSHVTECRVGDKPLRFAIDANGYRVRSLEEPVDFSKPTILSVGESVASGFGLNYDETYAAMLADRLGVQAANGAVQGYGADWAYVRLSEELPRFQHPIATLTLIHHGLVDRNVFLDRPHWYLAEDGTKTFVPRQVYDEDWRANSPVYQLFTTLFHTDEGLRRMRAFITATARETRARGAYPLFILTNCGPACMPDATGASSIDHTIFEGLDVDHVRVDIPPDLYEPAILHPRRDAQVMIADAVERALREHGVQTASR